MISRGDRCLRIKNLRRRNTYISLGEPLQVDAALMVCPASDDIPLSLASDILSAHHLGGTYIIAYIIYIHEKEIKC